MKAHSSAHRVRSLAVALATWGLVSSMSVAIACQSGPKVVAPDSFVVAFETSRGRVDVMARKDWAPIGVTRFYELLSEKHFDGARFYRVLPKYIAQFGLSGDPKVNQVWRGRRIEDEPLKHTNLRGTVSFARGGPATRSVQLFFNLKDNQLFDTVSGFGFPPIAEVVTGLPALDSLYSGYGDAAPRSGSYVGHEGPSQDSIVAQGNAYLDRGWPKLDYIKTARVVQQWPPSGAMPAKP